MKSKNLTLFLVFVFFILGASNLIGEEEAGFKNTAKLFNAVHNINKKRPVNEKAKQIEDPNEKKFIESFYENVKAQNLNKDNSSEVSGKFIESFYKRKSNIKVDKEEDIQVRKKYDSLDNEQFDFCGNAFFKDGFYIITIKRKIYFIVGGECYGQFLDENKGSSFNRIVSVEKFMEEEDGSIYYAYYIGNLTPLELKKFKIFWLANYNNKRFSSTLSNRCSYVAVLEKLTNHQVKFYRIESGKRAYYDANYIINNKSKFFPPILHEFKGVIY